MSATLKRAIDRMVEEAIRRILPTVMNEVLIATVARGTSGIVSEDRPVRPRKPTRKRRAPVREQKASQRKQRQGRRSPSDLRDLLALDESAGAEFYGDPRASYEPRDPGELEERERPSAIAKRIQALPPALQGLAEGMDLEDDGGEMWGANEHDSTTIQPSAPGEIRNIDAAARDLGIDFSQMKAVIGATTKAKRATHEDAQARMQFEQARLQRLREQLDGGKKLE